MATRYRSVRPGNIAAPKNQLPMQAGTDYSRPTGDKRLFQATALRNPQLRYARRGDSKFLFFFQRRHESRKCYLKDSEC